VGGGGGALLFAFAQVPLHVTLAMALVGVGCSPVLMAAYYIVARTRPPAVFATIAASIIGIGSLGNIAGAAPLAAAVTAFGWRETMAGIAALTLIVAVLLWVTVRDPAPVQSTQRGSVFDLLKMPMLWPIFVVMFVCYGPAAGLRGLWAGPYMTDVFGADAGGIGRVTLVMGLAMIAGNFAYGPLDRWFGTRKWVILGGNLMVAACFAVLWAMPGRGMGLSTALFALVGFFGATFPVVVAHARAFLPPHLTGRGVTLVNLFGIGGAGVMQIATGRLHAAVPLEPATAPYSALFAFYAVLILAGLAVYLLAQDRTD
jgi:predicted MFS family arabinose efflux permease